MAAAQLITTGTEGYAVQGCSDVSNAAAGIVGEYVEQKRSTVFNIPAATVDNLTVLPLTLTAGDWELSFILNSASGVGGDITAGFSQVSASLPGVIGIDTTKWTVVAPVNVPLGISGYRVQVPASTTQTWYVAVSNTTSSSAGITGRLSARRMR